MLKYKPKMNFNEFKAIPPNGTLGIAAPASPAEQTKVQNGLEALSDMGFQAVVGNHGLGRFDYLAGSDRDRAAILAGFMDDPAIHGLICLRGGYGSLRTAAFLDFPGLAEMAKPLVGFSDVTVILSGLLAHGLQSIHGPGLAGLADESEQSRLRLKNILSGNWPEVEGLHGLTLAGNDPAEGFLVGGNLTVLTHLLGTPWQPPTGGGLIFLEDVNEPAYKLDRCLTHLLSAGFFNGCRGVAAGRFGKTDPETVRQLLADRLAGLGIPIVSDLPFGHQPDNMALLVGGRAVIDPDRAGLYPKRRDEK